jgi:hypothetical protein
MTAFHEKIRKLSKKSGTIMKVLLHLLQQAGFRMHKSEIFPSFDAELAHKPPVLIYIVSYN